jgi:hypothetical protein
MGKAVKAALVRDTGTGAVRFTPRGALGQLLSRRSVRLSHPG